jgi:hypothetical protein
MKRISYILWLSAIAAVWLWAFGILDLGLAGIFILLAIASEFASDAWAGRKRG